MTLLSPLAFITKGSNVLCPLVGINVRMHAWDGLASSCNHDSSGVTSPQNGGRCTCGCWNTTTIPLGGSRLL